jgi:hypothetical protein
MAIPAAVKAAVTVVTNPTLLIIIGGIILGVVIAVIAPIAILLGVVDAGRKSTGTPRRCWRGSRPT